MLMEVRIEQAPRRMSERQNPSIITLFSLCSGVRFKDMWLSRCLSFFVWGFDLIGCEKALIILSPISLFWSGGFNMLARVISKNWEAHEVGWTHCLGMSYYVKFLGGLGSNEFHIKWRFGTRGSWCSTANSAYLARFLDKWAKLAVLFSW